MCRQRPSLAKPVSLRTSNSAPNPSPRSYRCQNQCVGHMLMRIQTFKSEAFKMIIMRAYIVCACVCGYGCAVWCAIRSSERTHADKHIRT